MSVPSLVVTLGMRCPFVLWWLSPLEELEQSAVDQFRMCPRRVVRPAFDGHGGEVVDEAAHPRRGGGVREDPVRVAVDQQDRYVNPLQVVAKVGDPRVDAGMNGVR